MNAIPNDGATLPTRFELDLNCSASINSIVYDPTGLIAQDGFRPERRDRILDVSESLSVGDIMVVESWLSSCRGAVLFIQPRETRIARLAAGLLFDYAAKKIVARNKFSQGSAGVVLYPGEVDFGPFMRLLLETEAGQVAAMDSSFASLV